VPLRKSNTSNEASCFKLVFTKFAFSVEWKRRFLSWYAPVRCTGAYRDKKALSTQNWRQCSDCQKPADRRKPCCSVPDGRSPL